MKALYCLAIAQFFVVVSEAATIATFGGGTDSIYTLQQPGAAPAPTVLATGGNPGGYLRLTVNIGSQHNFVPFDQTDPGTFPVSTFSFQFRVDLLGGGGADGFSFSYLDTAIYGTSGPISGAIFTAEDPAVVGALGFGFDTYGNAGSFDANGNGSDYSEITVFSNGILVSRVDDTRLLATPFDLKDGAWHTANGVVDFQRAKVSLSVDSTPIFENLDVPDLVPFESRVLFAGRTGGSNERASLDNLDVEYIPEPATGAILTVGFFVLRLRRRSMHP